MSDLDLLVTRAETVGGISRVYKANEVPKKPDGAYVVLSLDTGTPSTYTNDSSSDSMRTLAAQMFGESNDAIDDMATRLDNAFRDVTLDEMPGEPMSNRWISTGVARDPDGKALLYVLHTYRFHQED